MQQEDQSSEELCFLTRAPLNRKNVGISIHVRGITKWGRRDCVTAHGPRTDADSSPRRCSPSVPVPVRMIRPGIRVVVGGTSTVSGSRRIIPNIKIIIFTVRTQQGEFKKLTYGFTVILH